jgi:hypothetical protein
MQASTYGRGKVFAHSGDNFYLFTHESGHVFRGPRAPRSGQATRRDASGRIIGVIVEAFAKRTPRRVVVVAKRTYVARRPSMTMADMPSTPGIWTDK